MRLDSLHVKLKNRLFTNACLFFATHILLIQLCSTSMAQTPADRYSNEAATRGIDIYSGSVGGFGAGIALLDLDLDGDPDFVSVGAGNNLQILENDGNGFFIDRSPNPASSGVTAAICIAAGDVDGDRDIDLFIGRQLQHDLILLNQGDFQFTSYEWTTPDPILNTTRTTGASFSDLNGDDWLDLVVSCGSSSATQSWNHLFFNDGTGFFNEITVPGFNLPEPTFQIMPHDYDLDGDLDLYISNDRGMMNMFSNRILVNSAGTFGPVFFNTASVSVDSMGICAGDINLDGLPDIYVTNTTDPHPLLINNGSFQFEDICRDYGVHYGGVSWGCLFFDHGLDGDLDLLVADSILPDRLFENGPSTIWNDIAPQVEIDVPNFSACWIKGDLDGDGDIDLINQTQYENLKVFIQSGTPTNNYFKFRPLFKSPNYHAIGSKILVYDDNQDLIFSDQKTNGRNFKSESEWIFHHGVPAGRSVSTVEVIYPDGELRRFLNVPMNRTWNLPHRFLLGDRNGDRIIEIDDFNTICTMRTTTSNPIQSGFEFFDFDGNFIIDTEDLLALIEKSEWETNDCNWNGVNDLLDIFLNNSIDVNLDGVPDECADAFIRGDLNLDMVTDVGDSTLLLLFLFQGTPIQCFAAADLTNDSVVDIADFTFLASYLFSNSAPPPPPYPSCDNFVSNLSCEEHPCP